MLPFKKILCPVDFSESSTDPLKAANKLSVHFSSELIVVHVIPPMTIPVAPEGIPSRCLISSSMSVVSETIIGDYYPRSFQGTCQCRSKLSL
jgi:hypothetical protein